jgi:hypothetical protein
MFQVSLYVYWKASLYHTLAGRKHRIYHFSMLGFKLPLQNLCYAQDMIAKLLLDKNKKADLELSRCIVLSE